MSSSVEHELSPWDVIRTVGIPLVQAQLHRTWGSAADARDVSTRIHLVTGRYHRAIGRMAGVFILYTILELFNSFTSFHEKTQ